MLMSTGTWALVVAIGLMIDTLIHRRQLRELNERLERVERTLAAISSTRSTTPGAY